MAASRPFDALYDGTHTVSGGRDFYRQQAQFKLERVPDHANMFSELPHHPAASVRCARHGAALPLPPSPPPPAGGIRRARAFGNRLCSYLGYSIKEAGDLVPPFVPRTFHGAVDAARDQRAPQGGAAQVCGPHRPKYHRQPLPPAGAGAAAARLATQLAAFRLAPCPPPGPPPPPLPPEPQSKETATQSDFRESEAQTLPWSPAHVLAAAGTARAAKQAAVCTTRHCNGPEVLQLTGLTWGAGLPAGPLELRRLEAAREKRMFEAALPPLGDAGQLPLRLALIERWEACEWDRRAEEVREAQEERLEALDQALQVRESDIEQRHAQLVEGRVESRRRAQAPRLAAVHAARVRTVRRLAQARRRAAEIAAPGGSYAALAGSGVAACRRGGAVERYSDWASPVYAPLQREGHFPDAPRIAAGAPELWPAEPSTIAGLEALLAALPRGALTPRGRLPRPPGKLTYAERQAATQRADVEHMAALIAASKVTAHGVSTVYPLGEDTSGATAGSRHAAPLGLAGTAAAAAAAAQGQPPWTASGAAGLLPGNAGAGLASLAEAPPLPPNREAEAGLALLQRLLRGRAVQLEMHNSMAARMALVRELRLGLEDRAGSQPPPEQQSGCVLETDTAFGAAFCSACCAIALAPIEEVARFVAAADAHRLMQQRQSPDQPQELRQPQGLEPARQGQPLLRTRVPSEEVPAQLQEPAAKEQQQMDEPGQGQFGQQQQHHQQEQQRQQQHQQQHEQLQQEQQPDMCASLSPGAAEPLAGCTLEGPLCEAACQAVVVADAPAVPGCDLGGGALVADAAGDCTANGLPPQEGEGLGLERASSSSNGGGGTEGAEGAPEEQGAAVG